MQASPVFSNVPLFLGFHDISAILGTTDIVECPVLSIYHDSVGAPAPLGFSDSPVFPGVHEILGVLGTPDFSEFPVLSRYHDVFEVPDTPVFAHVPLSHNTLQKILKRWDKLYCLHNPKTSSKCFRLRGVAQGDHKCYTDAYHKHQTIKMHVKGGP